MSPYDAEVWRLLGPLEPEVDAVELYLGTLPVLPPSGTWPTVPLASAAPRSQIEVAARFLMALKPDLDPRLHRIVEAYHRHWSGAPESLPLAEIKATWFSLPRERPFSHQRGATQFLTGQEPWDTVQDGPAWQMALDLRRGGVPEERVRVELRNLVREPWAATSVQAGV